MNLVEYSDKLGDLTQEALDSDCNPVEVIGLLFLHTHSACCQLRDHQIAHGRTRIPKTIREEGK